jgi:predicted permease
MSPRMADITAWREQIDGFEQIESVSGHTYTITGLEEPLRMNGARVTPGFFTFLGASTAQGRTFLPEEGQPGGDRVAILSHSAWQNDLGGADVLGETLTLDNEPHVIVGIMPARFRMQSPFTMAQLWTPLVEAETENGASALARLAPGVAVEQVNAELAAAAAGAAPTGGGIDDWIGQARRPQDFLRGDYTRTVWSLQAAVAVVLLIAIANVINLLLARGNQRQQEMAVRAAIGGSRGRLARQLLVESSLLAAAGGALGLAIAVGGVRLIETFRPADLEGLGTLRLDPVVVLVTLGMTAVAGLLAGLLPALQAAGTDLHAQMSALSGRASEGLRGRRTRAAIVVAEVALSTVLVTTAGLLVGSFLQLQAVDPGFDSENLLTLRISVADDTLTDELGAEERWMALADSVRRALGGRAESITLSVGLPPQMGVEFGDIYLEDGPLDRELEGVTAATSVDHNYFDTLRFRWLAGTGFPQDAAATSEIPVVVNAEFARQLWPGEEAVGKQLRFADSDESPWRRVVGVVGDVKAFGLLSQGGQRQMYYPLRGGEGGSRFHQTSLMMSVRMADDPLASAAIVQQAIWSVDPEAPITEMATMQERLADTIALPRFNAWLMSGLAAVALGLALVGVYGVLSYSVTRRRHELGVRMALGASTAAVAGLVGRTSLALVGIGLVLGIGISAVAGRAVQSVLHGIEPSTMPAYVIASLALLATGAVATWIPARRATRVSPTVALRED